MQREKLNLLRNLLTQRGIVLDRNLQAGCMLIL